MLLVVSHATVALVMLGLTGHLWRTHSDTLTGRVFTALLGATGVWIIGSGLRIFVTDLNVFVAVTTLKYAGILTAPVLLLLFALIYDGNEQWVSRRVSAALFVLPAISLPVIATTRAHGLFYTDYGMSSLGSLSVLGITGVGPAYWAVAVYSWTLVAIASVLLVYAGLQRSQFYRKQQLLFVPAVLVVWASNLAYVFFSWPHIAVDPTPFGFAITSLLLAGGVFSTQLLDVSPAARSKVLDIIDDAVVVVDQSDRVVYTNAAAQPLQTASEAIGEQLSGVFPPEVAAVSTADPTTIQHTIGSDQRFYRRRELPIGTEGGRVIVLTEITTQKERQREVEETRDQLRQIIDLVPDPLFVKDADDRVLLSNEANARLHGMTPEALEGKRERDIESSVENIGDFEKYREREIEVLETGEPKTFEETLRDPDGEKHIFKTTRIPFRAPRTADQAVLGYAREMTELKESEAALETTKQRLEATNEELETLNRILRHDIRNDAVAQASLGRRLRKHVDPDGEQYLDQLLDRGEHIADITTDLRTLMQTMLSDDGSDTTVRLDRILQAEIERMNTTYEDARVTLTSAIQPLRIEGDAMLSSVFQNLLENAIVHNDTDAPEVVIAVAEQDTTVLVWIADNGPGIPPSLADDLFAKSEKGVESSGTGIGLYLVRTLLERYGGDITHLSTATRDTGNNDKAVQQSAIADHPAVASMEGAVFLLTLPKA
jgi:PAS domain S-box-containing protein